MSNYLLAKKRPFSELQLEASTLQRDTRGNVSATTLLQAFPEERKCLVEKHFMLSVRRKKVSST